jgi:hypothetical protein
MDGPVAPAQEVIMKRNGFVTIGMLAIAGSLGLMLMAFHSAPPGNAFSAASAQRTAEARPGSLEVMQALRPFDEHFVADAAE